MWFWKAKKIITPSSIEKVPNYQEAFAQAAKYTKKLGFDVRFDSFIDKKVLNDEKIIQKVCELSGIRDFSISAGQCLKWCHFFQPYFEEVLEHKVLLTVGQLWKSDKPVFNPSFDDFEIWLNKGIQLIDINKGMNLHAWLTIETGEIIELTLPSSLAKVNSNYHELLGAIFFCDSKTFYDNHKYFPMIIGNEIVDEINNKSIQSVLANTRDDLYPSVICILEHN